MPDRSRYRLFDDGSPYVDRFGALLALTVVTVITLSLVSAGAANEVGAQIRTVVVTALVGLTLTLSLRASGVARRWIRGTDVAIGTAVVVAVLLAVLNLLPDNSIPNDRPAAIPALWLALSVLSPVAVVHRVVRQQRVTVSTLMGAVSAYLLIPVAYYYLFVTLDVIQGNFFGVPVRGTSFMYFSLANITTLGYGDLAPRTDLGRLLATSEAVVGQVFLVTFVAMLVGRFAGGSRRDESDDATGGSGLGR